MKAPVVVKQHWLQGTLVLLLGLIIFLTSMDFPSLPEGHPGPGLFPKIMGILIMVAGLGLFFTRQKEAVIELRTSRQAIFVTGILLAVCIFPFVKDHLGFFPTLFLSVALVAILLQSIWWRAIILSAITCALIYLLFTQLLKVPL